MLYRIFVLFSFTLFSNISYAQKLNLDSIQSILDSKKGKERIDFLNDLLSDYSCENENQSKEFFEKVSLEIKQTKYPEGALKNYQNLGNFYYCFNKLDSAAWAFKQAIQIASKYNFHRKLGRNSSNLGYLYQKIGDIDSSLFYFQKGLKYGKISKDTVLIGAVSMGVGLIYRDRGLLDSAVQSFINSAKYADIANNKRLLLNSKLNIGTIYYTHQKSKINMNDYLEILTLAREIEDFQVECSALVFLGYLKTDDKEYKQAINYFQKALKINSSYSRAEVYKGIAKIYEETEEYDSALYYLKKGITVSQNSNSKHILPKFFASTASIYLKLEKYKSSIFFALKSIQTSTELDQKEFTPHSYLTLSKAYNNLGLFEKAYDAHVKFNQINTEILDSNKAKQIAEMETKYETEKKEKEINNLTSSSQIQKLKFSQQRLVYFLIIGAVIILALIMLFIYFNNKSKAKQASIDFEQKLLRNQHHQHLDTSY